MGQGKVLYYELLNGLARSCAGWAGICGAVHSKCDELCAVVWMLRYCGAGEAWSCEVRLGMALRAAVWKGGLEQSEVRYAAVRSYEPRYCPVKLRDLWRSEASLALFLG